MCTTTASSQVVLPAQPSASRMARRFVDEHWCTLHADLTGDDDARDRAHLLVTELVTNAVRHGRPPIILTLRCFGGAGMLIAVSDGSSLVPILQQVDSEAVGGRGVALVKQLSSAWGVQVTGSDDPDDETGHETGHEAELVGEDGRTRKTVWCRVLA